MQYSIISLLALFLHAGEAAYCHGSPDEGERENTFPIVDSEPRFVKSVPNAKLFRGGPEDAEFNIVHLWGTAYEMGYAHGKLLNAEMHAFIGSVWRYFEEMLINEVNILPDPVARRIADLGLNRVLDWTYNQTRSFSGDYFYEEMQGMADATGIDYETIVRIHMFPELTKGACSFFGAWDDATLGSKTLQLRALDWDVDGPFKDAPQITVYHTSEDKAFANIGWTGFIAAVSGMSSDAIAISEIGISYPDDSFGQGTEYTRVEETEGTPFVYLLRDILQFDSSLSAAVDHISTASRTCNLLIGVGSGQEEQVYGFQYSARVAHAFDDEPLLPHNSTWHPEVNDVVYLGMDWLCPGYNQKLGEQLSKYHGELSPDNVIHNLLPTVQTGNLHIAVYDLTDQDAYVSFYRRSWEPETNPANSFERQFTVLHMKGLWDEEMP